MRKLNKIVLGSILCCSLISLAPMKIKAADSDEGTWIPYDYSYIYELKDGSRKEGWLLWNDKWYYLGYDGIMKQNSTATIEGKKYCFKDNGEMASNEWFNVLGNSTSWLYCDNDGTCHIGWLYNGGNWYYFKESLPHCMSVGFETIGNRMYYFDSQSGVLQIGTFTVNDTIYTTDSSGAIIEKKDKDN